MKEELINCMHADAPVDSVNLLLRGSILIIEAHCRNKSHLMVDMSYLVTEHSPLVEPRRRGRGLQAWRLFPDDWFGVLLAI